MYLSGGSNSAAPSSVPSSVPSTPTVVGLDAALDAARVPPSSSKSGLGSQPRPQPDSIGERYLDAKKVPGSLTIHGTEASQLLADLLEKIKASGSECV